MNRVALALVALLAVAAPVGAQQLLVPRDVSVGAIVGDFRELPRRLNGAGIGVQLGLDGIVDGWRILAEPLVGADVRWNLEHAIHAGGVAGLAFRVPVLRRLYYYYGFEYDDEVDVSKEEVRWADRWTSGWGLRLGVSTAFLDARWLNRSFYERSCAPVSDPEGEPPETPASCNVLAVAVGFSF